MKGKMLQVRIEEDKLELLKAKAKSEYRNYSQVIRMFIDDYVKDFNKNNKNY